VGGPGSEVEGLGRPEALGGQGTQPQVAGAVRQRPGDRPLARQPSRLSMARPDVHCANWLAAPPVRAWHGPWRLRFRKASICKRSLICNLEALPLPAQRPWKCPPIWGSGSVAVRQDATSSFQVQWTENISI